MERIILHCDMNSFFASVELLELPHLAQKPVAVCGNPQKRHGIILAQNQIAKSYGVYTPETLWQAKQKCPNLVCVKPNMWKYKNYSKKINQIYENYTNMVEPFSIDESWLDVTGSIKLFSQNPEIQEILEKKGAALDTLTKIKESSPLSHEEKLIVGEAIGDHIRATVLKQLGLTLSVGVSYNKIFAKMGSNHKKPDATTLISPNNFQKIIWPKKIRELFFVGDKTGSKLEAIGCYYIGDLVKYDVSVLEKKLGKMGPQIYQYATGLEASPVSLFEEKRKIGTVGNGVTFSRNLKGEDDIRTALIGLSDHVSARLRRYELKCKGIKLDIKDPNFKVIARQTQLESPANSTEDIFASSLALIKKIWLFSDPIRLITLTAINLVDEDSLEQLSFWSQEDDARTKKESMDKALDSIRNKYGDTSITFGRLLDNDIGISLKHHIDDD